MRQLVACAILSLATVALAACGGGEDTKLLPGATAAEITANLDQVKQYAEEGECVGAADAAGEVSAQVDALRGIDAKLKEALQRGSEQLDEVVAGCEEEEPEETTEAETKPEGDEPPGQEKKEEKEREKEEKELEKEEGKEEREAPEEPPAEAPTTPPGESGGTGAPGGVSPGAPAGPEGSG